MKKLVILGLIISMFLSVLCACGESEEVMDVTIDGGYSSATEAAEKYFKALPELDFDTLIKASASLNKSCSQNTVSNYSDEKYTNGIETMKKELKKDMENISIDVTTGKETVYDSESKEYKAFVKEYEKICSGISKIQNYATVELTLKHTEGEHEFTEELSQNCIQIQDKWFVFDYSEEEENSESEADAKDADKAENADVDVKITGGGKSVDDAVAKYFKAISDKNAENMADVLVTMNKTALSAVTGHFDDAEHKKGLEAMKTEMASDPDTATLTPTVTETKTYEEKDAEFKTFLSNNAKILPRTKQIKAYATATVSLSISVPGETETFSATETLTCVKVDSAWFVMVTE